VDARGRSPRYGLRFRAYGRREYVSLGSAEEGWTSSKAQEELQNVLADVRRGTWRPQVVEAVAPPRAVPTFHEFASEWFESQKVEGGSRGHGLSATGVADLEWRLSNHLLPAFASRRVNQITIEDVDRYRRGKVEKGKLGATSINKTLSTLTAIMESAVEYGHADSNPARGRRRRLPSTKPTRSSLDRADHIAALL
jgi:integrase